MKILSKFQNIRTLRIKFIIIILPPIIFCFLMVSIVFAFLTYDDIKDLDHRIQNIADLQSTAISLPLWNYLDENIQQTLAALIQDPDITKAVVRDTKDRIIARAEKIDEKKTGKGIPEKVDIDGVNGLGLKLVRHLVTGQLKGEMHFNHDDGTEVCIDFKRMN